MNERETQQRLHGVFRLGGIADSESFARWLWSRCGKYSPVATWRDVRRIVRALPDTDEKNTSGATLAWTVHGKTFAWERPLRKSDVAALGESAPGGAILGIRTVDLEMKDALLGTDPAVFFTTPHFDGYAAVLVVLGAIRAQALRDVLVESWLARAPKRTADAFLASKTSALRGHPRRAKEAAARE